MLPLPVPSKLDGPNASIDSATVHQHGYISKEKIKYNGVYFCFLSKQNGLSLLGPSPQPLEVYRFTPNGMYGRQGDAENRSEQH